jgi:hypothetical protein
MLIAEQQGREFSDLRPDQDVRDTFRQNRALLIERARKLERMGLATEIETGKWKTGEYVSGTLVGSAQLASGRFAMIDDSIGFELVALATGARPAHRPAYHRHSARCRRHRMEFRQEAGVGAVSVPNIVTCLSPWGQTGAIR